MTASFCSTSARGLVGYYFPDKTRLIAAALRRIAEQDVALVTPTPGGTR